MFKESPTEKLIEYIQALPEREQKIIAKTLNAPKRVKKLSKKEKKTQEVLNDIKDGLLEIKEAKRTGKKLKTLEEFLNEI
jgi:hypothetical protein